MKKERNWFLEYYILAIILVVFAAAFFMVIRQPDIGLARRALNGLAQGRESVQDAIDWPVFKAMDRDVGADYEKLPSERQKLYFRKAFVINFSLSFKSSGGELRYFGNWRVYSRDKEKTVVAADTINKKTVLFTITKKHAKSKITEIKFKE
jgi:hypothetical protein